MPLDMKYEVKVTGIFQGDVWQNVLHYIMTEGGSGNTIDVGLLHDAVAGNVIPAITGAQSNESQLLAVRIQELGVPNPIVERRGYNVAGTNALNPLPASDAVLFQKRCNVGGRKNVGKLFLAATPEAWADGGVVDVSQAAYATLGAVLKTGIGVEGQQFRPGIYHKSDNSIEFVTIYGIRPQIARQNRRHVPVI